MTTFHKEFTDLVNLLKQHLQQDFPASLKMFSARENYEYYKNYAMQAKNPAKILESPKSKSIETVPVKPQVTEPKIIAQRPLPIKKTEIPKPLPSPQSGPKEIEKPSQALNPLGLAVEIDLKNIHKLFAESFPGHVILENIPQYVEHKNSDPYHKTTAVVLSLNDNSEHQTFLRNLTQAINDQICPAIILEAHSNKDLKTILKSQELKIVIAQKDEAFQHSILSEMLEDLQQRTHVFLLLPINDYLANRSLKATLWKQLKELKWT